jgi:hypothetical protein
MHLDFTVARILRPLSMGVLKRDKKIGIRNS